MPGSISVSDSFFGLALSHIVKTPTSNTANCLAWDNKFLMGNAPTVKKLHLDSLDVWLVSFRHGRNGVLFGIWVRTGNPDWVSSFFSAVFQRFNWNLMQIMSLPQISNYNVIDHTYCALYSSWFLHSSCSLWTLKMKVLCYFTCPSTQYQIPEDMNLLIQRVENLKSQKVNTHWEDMDWDMTTKLSGLNQKIVHLWHIVAGNCISFHFWS